MNDSKHPILYNGYIIKKEGNKFGAYNPNSGQWLNYVFNNWNAIKLILDNMK